MTLDYLDTWLIVNSQFVGADSKYGIGFALNTSLRLRIAVKLEKKITVEISYGNVHGRRDLA